MDMEALMAQAAELQNKVAAAQEQLAKTIVTQYYDEETANVAEQEFINVVQKKAIPDDIEEKQANEGELLTDIVVSLGFASSKGDVKRLIQGGGLKIDGEKVNDVQAKLSFADKNSVVLQAGKRNFIRLVK